MSTPLSDEWFSTARSVLDGLDSVGRVEATVQYAIASTPEGKVTFHAVVTDGVVTALATGKATDPDIVVSCNYDQFLDVLEGRKTADVAFMDASWKIEGDHKRWLLDLRPVREAVLGALQA
ncbi:MAG: SCP2 sterol-binding domain-containing protein [Acidimicrobiales bacterium]|nr:SCP2 sterol-binding domain-containing protein [Acidimicrobiales bacterium]MDG1876376.1 SCP2 sterol-binding domain-containing protein [Acidimicrobiales bacterium]